MEISLKRKSFSFSAPVWTFAIHRKQDAMSKVNEPTNTGPIEHAIIKRGTKTLSITIHTLTTI